MSNSLDDRLKNEYSTAYTLVVRESNFFPKAQGSDPKIILNKVNGSASPGIDTNGDEIPRSSIDPFRQSLGKFWTFGNKTRFKDSLADIKASLVPQAYNASFDVSNNLKFEDVSEDWQQIFVNGSSNNLNLHRDATRVKVFFNNSDLLNNRLGVLSLITDMSVKSSAPSYTVNQGTENPISFSFPKSTTGPNYIYNYRSTFDKSDIYDTALQTDIKMAETLDLNPVQQGVLDSVKNTWSNYSLSAIETAVDNGHMDYFYDFKTETYKYPLNFFNPLTKETILKTFSGYSDMAFNMDLPISTRASSLTNVINKSNLICDIRSSYNFYSKLYETATKKNENGKMFVTLPDSGNETVEFTERTLPLIYEVPIEEDETPAPLGNDSKFKFEKFGHKLLNCGYVPDDVKDETKAFNIVLYQDDQEYLSRYESIKRQFPFYVDFKFSTDSRRAFTQIFSDSGLMNDLLDTLIGNVFTREVSSDGLNVEPSKNSTIADQTKRYWNPFDLNPAYNSGEVQKQSPRICQDQIYSISDYRDFYKVVPLSDSIDMTQMSPNPIREGDISGFREFDLNRWLDMYISHMSTWASISNNQLSDYYKKYKVDVIRSYEATKNSKKFGSIASSLLDCPEQETTSLIKMLKTVKFMGKYRDLVKQNSRTYDQILNKDSAYTETLFYRIQKVALDNNGNAQGSGIVQNIWIPKPTGIEDGKDIMKYIDTQVVYDQNYEYTIYAYNLTIGSKYGFQIASHSPGFVTEKQTKFIDSMQKSAFNEGYGKTEDFVYYKTNPVFEQQQAAPPNPGIEVLQNLEKLYNSLRPRVYGKRVNEILIKYPDLATYITLESTAKMQSENSKLEEEIASYYSQVQDELDKVMAANFQESIYPEIWNLYNTAIQTIESKAPFVLSTQLEAKGISYGKLIKKQIADVYKSIDQKNKQVSDIINVLIPEKVASLQSSFGTQAGGVDVKGMLAGGQSPWTGAYFYKSLDQENKIMAMFDVVLEPDVKIVEVPFYKKNAIVHDSPSLAPEVDIVPLKGKNNDLKINFYPPSVDREVEPVYVDLAHDGPIFNKVRTAQDRFLLKAPISFAEALFASALPASYFVEPKLQFKSDDYPVKYQVYRMDVPPTEYPSFTNGTKKTINALKLHSFTDKLEQNKKYYYMFRSVDVHGNVSNPSPVYQVEMVENSGVVYPVISIYEFQKPALGLKTKPFKRRLQIDAETLQGIVNLEKSKLKDSDTAYPQVNQKPVLGIKDKGIFTSSGSQKYKFRIKSKHTGKIIDLNIAFISRHEQPTEEITTCGDSQGQVKVTQQPETTEGTVGEVVKAGSTFAGPGEF